MDYNYNAELFARKNGITLIVHDPTYGKHFIDDKEERYIFPCTLKRNGKSYSFRFGQSIAAGNKKPNIYGVLSCLQKYDVGSFQDFCMEFGYDVTFDNKKIYTAVCKEFKAVQSLFGDILDELQEIS
jgi:hypothetical protein